MRRRDQATLDAGVGLGLVDLVECLEAVDIGQLKVVDAVVDLGRAVDLIVGVDAIDIDLPDLGLVLEIHDDAVQPIGDLDADRIQGQAAGLLEVGELGDLLAVEPDLPAQAPGAQCGRFPVVLHKAHIVTGQIQADGFQAAQIEFLGIAGIGFEDHLVLVVHLHAVGILGIATVIGAERRLGVGHVPRLGPQHAQHRGRVHGPCTDLFAVGLPKRAAVGRPIFVQPPDDLLHGWDIVHGFSLN